ncbi:MAG: tRNA (adenosine(37)-N6)-threonylcarbamoyltransferase complex ATPase subunit type 1 TsaE, partial [Desulfobacterales bacterium]|nr:tRNA (adenosine(37)-N6)-threonylcarbamoyltransferase complex ATPase subunit type 1 TsaE [Desulfobacterales bacterium]
EHKGRKRFAHVDLYRLEQVEAAESLGLVDYFDGEGVTVIEWAERALTLLPSEKLLIEFKIQSKDERTLQIEALGES